MRVKHGVVEVRNNIPRTCLVFLTPTYTWGTQHHCWNTTGELICEPFLGIM
jgi:hypothetical protein